jgi:hypothetical protein
MQGSDSMIMEMRVIAVFRRVAGAAEAFDS